MHQNLSFHEMSGGRNLDKELSFLSDAARINVQTAWARRRSGPSWPHSTVLPRRSSAAVSGSKYTGRVTWMSALADHVPEGQLLSLVAALGSIAFCMMLCLRSAGLGLVSVLPNIVPMGLMGVLDIPLMIFSCVIVGVCVDDTTHFFVNFKRNLAMHCSEPSTVSAIP